jgi:dihydroxy-acid dehydratase
VAALRSNFESGTTRWAVRRAQWRALGIGEDQLERPKIAVVNSSSTLSSCYTHLDELSRVVQEAIAAAGGLAFEIRTAAPSDFITSAGHDGRYLMPTRDLVVNDVEVMVEGAQLDGFVCLSSCDKTTPAHLMAAGRLDLPSLVVIGGYQMGGHCAGRFIDIDDVYESIGAYDQGRLSLEDLSLMADSAISGPGVCAGLGTANSMHIVAEALGMTMPGSAPVHAGGARMNELAAEAGRRIVGLIESGLSARQVLTPAALHNAATVAIATGCSVNVVRHLSAVAVEAGLNVDVVALFERLAPGTPLLCAVRPNGDARTEDLEAAGGALAVMRELGDRLDLDAMTVTGAPLGEVLEDAPAPVRPVIRPLGDPVAPSGGLRILRGSLAPDGAIVKMSAVGERSWTFRGPARVFGREGDAMVALAEGSIAEQQVVVLRGLGVQGGPGTMFAAGFVAALVGAGLSSKVAVVTDGELSGLNRGLTVGQVMPEAAAGGPLALVEDGDEIAIDLEACLLDLCVDPKELAERRRRWVPQRKTDVPRGWLRQYEALVQPIAAGATLAPPQEVRPLSTQFKEEADDKE